LRLEPSLVLVNSIFMKRDEIDFTNWASLEDLFLHVFGARDLTVLGNKIAMEFLPGPAVAGFANCEKYFVLLITTWIWNAQFGKYYLL
jgi:hypothetical protein